MHGFLSPPNTLPQNLGSLHRLPYLCIDFEQLGTSVEMLYVDLSVPDVTLHQVASSALVGRSG